MVYVQPMAQSFTDAVRKTVDEYLDGIRQRPRMYGPPSAIEATWWTLLSFEGLFISPMPEAATIEQAKRTAHERVANKHGWSGVLPLYAHVQTEEDLVPLLDEWRTELLRVLTAQ